MMSIADHLRVRLQGFLHLAAWQVGALDFCPQIRYGHPGKTKAHLCIAPVFMLNGHKVDPAQGAKLLHVHLPPVTQAWFEVAVQDQYLNFHVKPNILAATASYLCALPKPKIDIPMENSRQFAPALRAAETFYFLREIPCNAPATLPQSACSAVWQALLLHCQDAPMQKQRMAHLTEILPQLRKDCPFAAVAVANAMAHKIIQY